MATTANGWPYVEPADHPLEYPAVSQQLANKLESKVTGRYSLGGGSRATSTALASQTPYDVVWESFVSAPSPPVGYLPCDASGVLIPAGTFAIVRLEISVTMPTGTSGVQVNLVVEGAVERMVQHVARQNASTIVELVSVVSAFPAEKRVSARIMALQLAGTLNSASVRAYGI